MIGPIAIAAGFLAILDDDNEVDFNDLFKRAVAFENPRVLLDELDDQQQDHLYFILNEWINASENEEEKKVRLKQAMLFMEKVQGDVRTDNDHFHAQFNAIPYLQQASVGDLRKLADCNFQSDYPADDVAWWMRDIDNDVACVMYEVESDSLGFEVHINEDMARAWLDAARPGWDADDE